MNSESLNANGSPYPKCPQCGNRLGKSGVCTRCALSCTASGCAPDDDHDLRAGAAVRYFGDFELLDDGRHGGMGVVYAARQATTGRRVALKMLHRHCLLFEEAVERFLAEVRAATRLDHPSILPVYEVGAHRGQHYYTMKLVERGSLASQMKEGKWTLAGKSGGEFQSRQKDVALLIERTARGLHHAHQRGVLHRDVKPANILIDELGHPYLVDFGIAKILDCEKELTRTEEVLGTPHYMSPEQARGNSRDVTLASDVFSLGVVLYELLAGCRPFRGESALAVMHKVTEAKASPIREINPAVALDLDIICGKCLENDPGTRYATALELAEDLARWSRHEPILARAPAWHDRAFKWMQRNPLVTGLSATVALSLICGFASTLWQLQRAEDALAQTRELSLHTEARLVRQLLDEGKPEQALPLLARQVREAPDHDFARLTLLDHLTRHPYPLPRFAPVMHAGEVSRVVFSPDGSMLATCSADHTAKVVDARTGRELMSPVQHREQLSFVSFSPDGKLLATVASNSDFQLTEVPSGKIRAASTISNAVPKLFFTQDSRKMLGLNEQGTVLVWSTETGEVLQCLETNARARDFAILPTLGKVIVAGDRVVMWDLNSGRAAGEFSHPGSAAAVDASADGQRLLTCGADDTCRLWDTAELATIGEPFIQERFKSACFSPGGDRVLTMGRDSARIWDAASGEATTPPMQMGRELNSARFNREGSLLVTACDAGTVQVWNAIDGTPIGQLMRHSIFAMDAVFSPSNDAVATASVDNTAVVWDLIDSPAADRMILASGSTGSAIFEPSGKCVVAATTNGECLVWSLNSATNKLISVPHHHPAANPAVSPDGRLLVTAATPHEAQLWDALSRSATHRLAHPTQLLFFAFDPANRWVASATAEPALRVWDCSTGVLRAELAQALPPGTRLMSMHFGPSSELLFCGWDGTVRRWNWQAGTHVWAATNHTAPVMMCEISPSGKSLASAGLDRKVVVLRYPEGTRLWEALPHQSEVIRLAFSPGGDLLATATFGGTVHLWDALAGREVLPPLKHSDHPLCSIQFSPDGSLLASACKAGVVRLWDVHTGLPIGQPLSVGQSACSVQFSHEGRHLLASSKGGPVMLFEICRPAGAPPEWLPELAEAVARVKLTPERTPKALSNEFLLDLRKRLAAQPGQNEWSHWARVLAGH